MIDINKNARLNIDTKDLKQLAKTIRTGDRILLTGYIFTARDAAHKRIIELINAKKPLPFDLNGAAIYYAGPTKAPVGLSVGSCGPTTSSRMDIFTPALLEMGLSCMIGKGGRSDEVEEAIARNQAVYLCAIGGAGALACRCIKSCEVIAFEDLGCESIKKLYVENFPLIAAIDSMKNNIFKR